MAREVSFTYDSLNRPLTQEYGINTTISFQYDLNANGKGRISSITDEHGSRTFFYNAHGQVTSETRTIDNNTFTTGYGYSPTTGEIDTLTYPSGMIVTYGRDSVGQVESITVDGNSVINAITHLPFGPLKSANLGQTTLIREYDQRYNLADISAGSFDRTYGRDAEGHVTSISDITPPTLTGGSTTSTIDPNSNKLLSTSGTEAKTYIYDDVGNMTSDGTYIFTYDDLNRITRVESGGSVIATYGYDSSNRRITKTVGSSTTYFIYDASSNLIAESDHNGVIQREYIYLDGEVVAVKEQQGTPALYYYINDHLGTPQQLIDTTGAIVWQASYLPFGKAVVTLEQVVNNIRFPGQYFDAETGLHYNWHRFYDPSTGRYITADPIGLEGGMNLFAYVGGNPINLTDPLGLKVCFDQDYYDSCAASAKDRYDCRIRYAHIQFDMMMNALEWQYEKCKSKCWARSDFNPVVRAACFATCNYILGVQGSLAASYLAGYLASANTIYAGELATCAALATYTVDDDCPCDR